MVEQQQLIAMVEATLMNGKPICNATYVFFGLET